MVKMFRLALAASERRSEDAVRTFSDIVDSTFTGPTANYHHPHVYPFQATYRAGNRDEDGVSTISESSSNNMPPLVPLDAKVDAGNDYFGLDKVVDNDGVKLVISETEQPLEANHPVNTKIHEVEGDADVEETEVEEDAEDEEEEEEEAEEEEAEDEEEETELQLVPVRIKKVTYWKDEISGDIYQYLPDDECGDKVGTYVYGKAVFDQVPVQIAYKIR